MTPKPGFPPRPGSSMEVTSYCPCGVRHTGGMTLVRAFVELENRLGDAKGKGTSGRPMRPKVPMHRGDPPDTQCLTLPATPRTIASRRWPQCPPPPAFPVRRKTPVLHSLHASILSQSTRPFRCRPWLCFVAVHGDRSLQFSSQPPSSRAFALDTEKSTRVCCETDVVMTSVTLPGSFFGVKPWEHSGNEELGKQASRPMVVYLGGLWRPWGRNLTH